MEGKNWGVWFTIGFFVVILIVAGVLVYVFSLSSENDAIGEIRNSIWAALIFVFVLFGVVVISLYLKRIRGRDSGKGQKIKVEKGVKIEQG